MGNSKSRGAAPAAASASSSAAANGDHLNDNNNVGPAPLPSMRKIELPEDMRPSAAVIGAGIAGVHVAKELASIGFRVTVLDQRDGPAQGETAASCGVIVPSTFVASPWKLRFFSDLCLGSLPLSARSLVATETPISVLTSVAFARWSTSRFYQRKVSLAALQASGEDMAVSSVDAIRECLSQDSRLRSCVIAETSAPAVSATTNLAASSATPDLASGIIIDAPKWTRTLAEVTAERLDVKYLYGHRTLRIKTKITNGVEWAPYIVVKKTSAAPHETPDAMGFDLVIVAAGAATRDLTWLNDPVPIHPFGGYCIDLPWRHSIVQRLKEKIGETKLFGNLSEDGWLRAAPARALNNGEPTALRLAGLASLDDTVIPSFDTLDAASVLSRRLRLNQGVDLDGVESNNANRSTKKSFFSSSPPSGAVPTPDNEIAVVDDGTTISARRYSRGITPDGLPIVSRLGSMKNVFICSGFGDNSALLAPGAARLLANLVVARNAEDELTPYSLGRFKAFRYMDPTRKLSGRGFTGNMIAGEQALCRIGETCLSLLHEHVFSHPVFRNVVVQSERNY